MFTWYSLLCWILLIAPFFKWWIKTVGGLTVVSTK